MAEANRLLGMYLHLARVSQARRQPLVRDKLLILAGVQAEEMGLAQISALCRHKILAHNGRHLVRSWPTMNAALANDEFQTYLKQLKRRFSPEKIEHMVHSLGIELGRERDAYFDDCEYAAALLDTDPGSIDGILSAGRAAVANRASEERRPASAAQAASADRTQRRMPRWLVRWAPLILGILAIALVLVVERYFQQ
jgi:hypothetical protein